VSADPSAFRSSRTWLTGSQYKTDANLAARQSIYVYQRPRHDIAWLTVDLAGLRGGEVVTDVGCGNGVYLAELGRRGHTGPVLGVDLSPGMLRAARGRAPGAGLTVADATALPLPDNTGDVTLAMHMLYHVPEPAAAVRELRRVTRPGGRVLVALNGEDHLAELRGVMGEVLPRLTPRAAGTRERLSLEAGEQLLAACFTTVTRHDFTAELVIPGPEPIADYVRSGLFGHGREDRPELVTAVLDRMLPGPDGNIRVRTHSGCLVCS